MPLFHITYRARDGVTGVCRQYVPGTNNSTRERSSAIREASHRPDVAKVLSAVRLPEPLTPEAYERDRERTAEREARHAQAAAMRARFGR